MVEKPKYHFKKRKRKDLINAMQITVYSLTNAELDKTLRKTVEEAVQEAIKQHKDSQALAYSVVKE
jgi:tRNA/tmRNA/rRNA uracil-C5-methylase (TrmA/RlmC/RlmD family)